MNGDIFEITTVPVGAVGVEGGWLMVVHDVTRERAIQSSIQQHQRLAAVGHLAAGIAHDFNNIVAVIILYVQMLQRNPMLQEIDHSRLNVIRDQAQNASKLIRQILDFSRQTVIERQPTDLLQLIHESVAFWQRTLPESIAIRLTIENEGPAQILAEASSIQQALTNLAVNARDAMPNGGELQILVREIVVDEQATPPVIGLKKGRWFEVLVIDNGDGIAPEHLPHVFDPFFTTKDIGKGTGLGLAQVYGIVQQHGGLVTAQSEQGKGTSICLFLPALGDEVDVQQEVELQELAGEGSETILLVEDNAPAREATAALLEMMGYRVFCANDGRAGLELYNRHAESIQLVLSDLVMPEMGGLELYQNIVETNPAICMMIMTGYALEDEQYLRPEYVAVDWLQKPFTVKQLTVAVRRVLERARHAQEELDEARDN
jgi:signal transduction histidine kinase/ActR/RegA family two-component response regulator